MVGHESWLLNAALWLPHTFACTHTPINKISFVLKRTAVPKVNILCYTQWPLHCPLLTLSKLSENAPHFSFSVLFLCMKEETDWYRWLARTKAKAMKGFRPEDRNTVVAQTWTLAQNVPVRESDKVHGKQVFTAKPSLLHLAFSYSHKIRTCSFL